MKLAVIADRIAAHLKRFENDKRINRKFRNPKGLKGEELETREGLQPYYNTGACASGSRVFIKYISYQGQCSLTKAEAIQYLEGLDAGFIGRHYGYFRGKE